MKWIAIQALRVLHSASMTHAAGFIYREHIFKIATSHRSLYAAAMNSDHWEMFKKGATVWNAWRKENPDTVPDLSWIDLSKADFRGINLVNADLTGARMEGVNLTSANLSGATLHQVKFTTAILKGANLSYSHLGWADLSVTDLREAIMEDAQFGETRLREAYLEKTNLRGAVFFRDDLSRASLVDTDFTKAQFFAVILADLDLSRVIGLETIRHAGPSSIGIDTLIRSHGQIPEVFLKGAGIPDEIIKYVASLNGQPIQFYSCFISYSSKDDLFVKRLHADLQSNGVRCWFAPDDLKIGDKFRVKIDEAIHIDDKLLLVLSDNSVKSPWVEKEVETAFEKERQQNRTMLFPIRLDRAIMNETAGWAADIKRSRHIGDFEKWTDPAAYKKAFDRLLRDLKNDSASSLKKH